jgi:hypothetical protein
LRGRPPTPRFRTIQVCPKDLPAVLSRLKVRKTERTGQSAGLIAQGEKIPMLDTNRREFIALVGGGGLLLAAKVKRRWPWTW